MARVCVCFRSVTVRTWRWCRCGPTNWSFFLMRSDRWPNYESWTLVTTGTRTHTHACNTFSMAVVGSALTACSCHGNVLCGLYSAWAKETSLFALSLSLTASSLPLCLSLRLKNLPFTFTKLKDLAALWLSDNQVSALPLPETEPAHQCSAQTHPLLLYRMYMLIRSAGLYLKQTLLKKKALHF